MDQTENLPIPTGSNPSTIKEPTSAPMLPQPVKGSAVTPSRVQRHKRSKFNPIRNLTPQSLVRDMEAFDVGNIAPFARLMEVIAERDDTIKSVFEKRKASVKRMSYKVVIDPDIEESQKEEAEEHAKALRYFYKNLSVSNAIDRSQRGHFELLVAQMMDSVAYKYACHELLWQTSPEGLTCRFNYVPLYFFENMDGDMKFLKEEGQYNGVPLEENGWMITCGPGLMRASAVAFMYKNLAMKSWVIYNDKFGMPYPVIKTDAIPGTAQHDSIQEALSNMVEDSGFIISREDDVSQVTFGGSGTLPQPELVERMDRFISILWRGGDLSTISKGQEASGVTGQQEESSSLEQDDAQLISGTLQQWIDPLVIGWTFGWGVKPLAYIKVCAPDRKDVNREIQIDNHLSKNGCPQTRKDIYERYNRQMPEEGTPENELTVDPMKAAAEAAAAKGFPREAANEDLGLNRGEQSHLALLRSARMRAAEAESVALEPLWDRLDGLMEILNGTDKKAALIALKKFRDDLPELQREIARNPVGARAFEAIQSAGLFNGLTEATVARN